MQTRGRNARTALAVVTSGVTIGESPDPPASLSPREKAVWRATIDAMPPGWFGPESWPLVERLCVVQCQCRDLDQALKPHESAVPTDPEELARYKTVTALRVTLTAQLASLSTKLRITPHSRYDPESAHAAMRRHGEQVAEKAPWADA
jgi:hypothetical protein